MEQILTMLRSAAGTIHDAKGDEMRKTTILVATLLVTAGFVQMAAAADAQPFQLTLPTGFGAFTAQSQTAKSPSGDIHVTNWVSKSPTGEAVVVSVSKMPAKIEDPAKLLAGSRDSLLKSVNGTLDSETKIDGDMPGTRVDFHSGTNAFLRARFQVKGDTLYQLLYVGRSAEQRSNPSVDSLFQSFSITDSGAQPQTAAAVPGTSTTH